MRYPLFLDVAGRRAVVVGGGAVGARRARALVEAGAEVTVVDPRPSEVLPDGVAHVARAFAPDDLAGAWLVLACADDPAVNAAVADAASAQRIWCARADDANASAAWVPATTTVDDVHLAVSAGGDPGRARGIRDGLDRALRSGEVHARRTRRGGGRVVLVGGGPGDPGLLTISGYHALLDADVVVVDRLAPVDLLHTLPDDVEVVDVGKEPRGHAPAQEEINALLVEHARDGKVVVRLKGGDPFVLGRGSEEVAACVEAGVAVDVIPGVSSVTAAPTLAGIPLTRRGLAQHFAVASGHVPPGDPRSSVDWAALGASNATLLLLMAIHHLPEIAAALVDGGRPASTPAAVVENASLPHQRVVRAPLGDIASVASAEKVVPPAVVVVGEVVDDLG